MQEQVLEYFNNYFGGTLNESTSDEEIMEAVNDLVALRDAVLEAVEEEIDEGAKISRDPQLVIGLGKGRPAGRIEKKVKEFAPKELAISPERLADTRENIKSYLKSKLKKKSNIIKKKKLKSKMPGILPYTDAQWKAHKKKNNVQTTDINWSREYIKNKGKVPYGQRPKQKRPFGPKQKPGKDNVQPL